MPRLFSNACRNVKYPFRQDVENGTCPCSQAHAVLGNARGVPVEEAHCLSRISDPGSLALLRCLSRPPIHLYSADATQWLRQRSFPLVPAHPTPLRDEKGNAVRHRQVGLRLASCCSGIEQSAPHLANRCLSPGCSSGLRHDDCLIVLKFHDGAEVAFVEGALEDLNGMFGTMGSFDKHLDAAAFRFYAEV